MSHSWLQKKRKADLIDLAQKARLPDADGLLKDDLVEMLGIHLNSNETTFAKHPEFRDYYGRNGSPVKRERSSPLEPVTVTKATRRRTLIKEPSPEPTPERSTAVVRTPASARTPKPVSRRVSEINSQVDIPASPAQLAEVADQSFQVVKSKATELWDKTRIDELKEFVRENASSVATIQTIILLVEAVGLQWNTLDSTALFAMPAALSSYSSSQDVRGPNGWALLTAEWWAPATLWSLTSWVLPLVFSYFFNLTLRSNTSRRSSDRQYPADPLIFNITRAILAYSAYRETVNAAFAPKAWGPFSEYAVARVGNHVPGGYYGLQIGSLVGILVSMYDAALKK
ncbi:hypothetical protein DDE82_004330 [Stemphylium lycopersici]|uniref:Uncharacterized protein n=1 Tax=Stemphylium lycopersici TaxID=183478 RepID=A0A364N9Z3_STELY|nr:hypothetical protein TW65_06466 [Stemphylium lycopersici]RAR04851.1 hypothetical protein DDE82_004330 [Stemphylium lycopersici]RAR14135.1 hypothetical protein DDE83_002553 [Stemphylium lycopersici]